MKRSILSLIAILFIYSSSIYGQNTTMNLPVSLFNDDGDSFVIIAHRGASAYAPENTMAAFRKAVEMDAEMIELDVLLTKDGVPVVFHDETLDRTTNGSGNLADHTLEELKLLDTGSWFSDEFKGEKIPTLEEVIRYSKGRISINIEIKTEAVTEQGRGGVEEKSLELVNKYEMRDYVIFSSFDYRAIRNLQELDPDINRAVLYEKRQSGKKGPAELNDEFNIQAFNCSYKQLSKAWMTDAKNAKLPVFVYTVNEEKRMKSLIERGVSGIFSDKPDLLRATVENLWEKK